MVDLYMNYYTQRNGLRREEEDNEEIQVQVAGNCKV